MRFTTIDGRLTLLHDGHVVDIADTSSGRLPADPVAACARWQEVHDWAAQALAADPPTGAVPVGDHAEYGPPVPGPRQVFAVALNYPSHAAEARLSAPADPLVFTKFPSCITHGNATVTLPSSRVDWEVELVVVIAHGGYRIPAEQGWEHVAAVTVGQDLSERDVQLAGPRPQFSLGKSFPGFGPTGPVMVAPTALPDPDDLTLSCWRNDDCVQHARTRDMVFPVPELIARLSATCRLLPGDLVFTGTPAGVGHGREPRQYLTAGDALTSRVEGVAECTTRFVAG